MTVAARLMPHQWNGATTFRARSIETGIRTACRKLGVSCSRGRTVERVGARQWRVTGNDLSIMVVVSEDSAPRQQRSWPRWPSARRGDSERGSR